jgi:RHS repeat-associated protein
MGHFITDRLHSKGDGSAFYPYGESKTGAAGDDGEQFATYTRDQSSGLDYADQRWYSSRLGRFTSADPYMAAAGAVQNPIRPSSWGKYGYVEADPISYLDRPGLYRHRADSPSPPSEPSPGPGGRLVLGDENDRAVPVEDNPEGAGGGVAEPYRPRRIMGEGTLKSVIGESLENCNGSGITGIKQRLKTTLHGSDLIDARMTGRGGGLLREFVRDARWGDEVLYNYLDRHSGGRNMRAAVLITYDGRQTNNIAFRWTFFDSATSDSMQSVIGIHELLHRSFNLNSHMAIARMLNIDTGGVTDDEGVSQLINQWIVANCEWAQ